MDIKCRSVKGVSNGEFLFNVIKIIGNVIHQESQSFLFQANDEIQLKHLAASFFVNENYTEKTFNDDWGNLSGILFFKICQVQNYTKDAIKLKTIAKEWWSELSDRLKVTRKNLCHYKNRMTISLTPDEIANIYYILVVIPWLDALPRRTYIFYKREVVKDLSRVLNKQEIISIFLNNSYINSDKDDNRTVDCENNIFA